MKDFKPMEVYPLKRDDGWKKMTGELPVMMVNDYLFRALMQSDNEVLLHHGCKSRRKWQSKYQS